MSITIKELAALAGVSRGTVDRALNGRAGVAPEVEQRILQLAREHHYVPNRAGKALATRKKPFLLGVTMPSVGNPFFDEVRRGILETAETLSDYGLNVRLLETRGLHPDTQVRAIRELEEQGIQALALAAINHPDVIRAMDSLGERGIPTVTFNADVEGSGRSFYVGSDYHAGGRLAGELMGLLTMGTASVGVITGSEGMLGHRQRIAGFQELTRERFPQVTLCTRGECMDDEELGYTAAAEMLARHPELEGLYLTGGGVSGCCRAVQESGRELTVIAFDAVPGTQEYVRNGIIQAVICQQPYLQGQMVLQLLSDWFFSGRRPDSERYYVESQILIRENIGSTRLPG